MNVNTAEYICQLEHLLVKIETEYAEIAKAIQGPILEAYRGILAIEINRIQQQLYIIKKHTS